MTASLPGGESIPPGTEGILPSISPKKRLSPLPVLATLALLLPIPATSQVHEALPPQALSHTDWPHYAGDQGTQRYTPLPSLTRENFRSLETTWLRTSPDARVPGAGSDKMWAGKHESTPLMSDGVLYNSTSFSQAYALDAATGRLLWVFDPENYLAGTPPNFGFINRGLALWPGSPRQHIFLATGDSRLIALNTADGRPISSWGESGEVNLLEGLGLEVSNDLYGVSSPPLVCGEAVIVGSSILEFPPRPDTPPGDVRAFNARTGELMWHFHSIPKDGEYGADTWEDGSNNRNAAANVWTYMSCDEEAGLAYLPFGTPVNDFWGGNRPGDNLFGESLVAVDMNTGERRWHFQTTRHGLWDYDLPAAPVLLDMPDGRKLAAQVTKQALLFVFDRLTGEPVWPIEDLPVPDSDVPGERASETQPIPTRPAPFDRQGFTKDDLNDLTPELLEDATAIFESMDGGALYSPPTQRGRLMLPGVAASWSGAAFDPVRGYLYVPSITLGMIIKVIPIGRNQEYWLGTVPTPAPFLSNGMPMVKPPYGRITAIDMETGEHAWMTPVGRGYERLPQFRGREMPEMGIPSRTFVVATSNLLLAAQEGINLVTGTSPERNAARYQANPYLPALRAFDLDTGELIGEVPLPGNATGALMAYEVNGKPYVVIPIGGAGLPAQLVALTLPSS